MTIMPSRDWENRRLIEQVRSLHHLPPGAELRPLEVQSDRDLFAALLHLREEIDPLTWLEENHGDLVARVLLWTALDEVRTLQQGVRRALQAGQATAVERERRWLGHWLDLPENEGPLQPLQGTRPTTATPELLRTVFQGLRVRRRTNQTGLVRAAIDDKSLLLLDELFRSPETTDPLQWIREQHGDQAASQTVRYLLAQVRPPILFWHGQAMRSRHLELRLAAEEYAITLDQIALGTTAFTLTFRARLPERLLRSPEALLPGTRTIAWEGVERIVDDLGYHYLVWHRLPEGRKRWFWRYDLWLQLLCYPAIAPAATRLTLHSDAASLVIRGLAPGEQPQRPRPLRYVALGDLTWNMNIA